MQIGDVDTLLQKSFKEQFPRDNRPENEDLEAFWNDDIYSLFREFAEYYNSMI